MALNLTDLQALINQYITTNGNEEITGAVLNNVLQQFAISVPNLITNTEYMGLFEWNATRQYIVEQCVVIDGNIYQAVVTPTFGTFIEAEWQLISTYIESTSGFDDYIKIINGISTPSNKIEVLGNDVILKGKNTGFYQVTTNNPSNVGSGKDYPLIGTGTLTVWKSTSDATSVNMYINQSLPSTIYMRNEAGNWYSIQGSESDENTYFIDYTAEANTILYDQFLEGYRVESLRIINEGTSSLANGYPNFIICDGFANTAGFANLPLRAFNDFAVTLAPGDEIVFTPSVLNDNVGKTDGHRFHTNMISVNRVFNETTSLKILKATAWAGQIAHIQIKLTKQY